AGAERVRDAAGPRRVPPAARARAAVRPRPGPVLTPRHDRAPAQGEVVARARVRLLPRRCPRSRLHLLPGETMIRSRSLPLPLLACLLASALLLPARVSAQGTVVKLATLVPEGSVWDKALRDMGAEWSSATQGRVSLRVYPGGVAGDEPDVVRKMRI